MVMLCTYVWEMITSVMSHCTRWIQWLCATLHCTTEYIHSFIHSTIFYYDGLQMMIIIIIVMDGWGGVYVCSDTNYANTNIVLL